MKIYNFDRQTGVFLSESEAEPSQMEPGEFLTPAFATAIAPPAVEAGSVAVFNSAKKRWAIKQVAAAAATPAAPAATFEEKVLLWRATVTMHANSVAQAYDFDSMNEAVTYADEPAVPLFQEQGLALRAWRSLLWAAFDRMVAEIKGGVQAEPKDQTDLISRLPVYGQTEPEPVTPDLSLK